MYDSPTVLLTFAAAWMLFGAVAVSGFWSRNYTRRKWRREVITAALLIGGVVSLILAERYLRYLHRQRHRL